MAAVPIGVLIPLPEIPLTFLKDMVDAIVGVDRKIAIAFKNNTEYTLESVGIYFESGSSKQDIPHQIPSQMVALLAGRKSEYSCCGSVGTFPYYMYVVGNFQDVNKTVHLMWSVPFDYNCYSNWWNVVVVDGREEASSSVYKRLYNGSGGFPYPHKPDQCVNISSNGFQLLGSMTSSGHATLEVEIKKA